MVRKCSWLSVLILLLVSTGAQALGLGDIRLESALNQNFKADIELLSVEKGGIADVRVSLASPEAFARAGVERTFLLSRLRYKPERMPDGTAVIHVFTLEPVREPFLNFLIEVNWPKGRLLREYTVLLDPPVTLERKPAPVEPPKSSEAPPPAKKKAAAPPPPAVAKPAVAPEPAPAVESPPVEPKPEAKPEPKPEAKPKPPTPDVAAEDVAMPADETVGPGDYSVVWGDTMWGIVTRSRIEGVSDKQLMMAIYHANRRAFYGNNINNLKAGEILRIPEKEDALKIDIADANNQYREHVDIWLASKRGEAPTVATKEAAAPTELAGGEGEAKKDTAAATEESAAAEKEAAAPADETKPTEQEKPEEAVAKTETESVPEAELKIVTARPEGEGEAGPSEGDTTDKTEARLNRELLLAQEELESARQEGTELESRVGDLEGQIEDLQRLITLKSDQLAQLQAHAAETAAAEAETAPALPVDEGQTETVVEEAAPAALPVEEGQAGAEETAPALPVDEGQTEAVAEEVAPAALPVEEGQAGVETGVEETAPALPVDEGQTEAVAEEAAPPATLPVDEGQAGVEEASPLTPPTEQGIEPATPPAAELAPAVPTPEVKSIVVPIEEEAAPTKLPVEDRAAPAVAETKSVTPPPARRKPEPIPEPGLLEGLLGGTSMLTIGGGLLVIVLLLFLILRRKGGGEENFEESILLDRGDTDVSESTLEEVVEGPGGHTEDTSFLSDFSPSDIDALQDETGEVDPLSEADVYISYGRYQQAEELIRQAIDKDPARQALKHKLFEILYALKDADGFSKLAEESAGTAVETHDADAWDKVLSMGKTLDSANPLFAGAEPMHGAVEEPVEEEPDDDGLDDFDLDGIAAELDAEEAAQTTAVDLDRDVSGMDAIEETTLDIGTMASDDEDDAIDDLDLSGLDDDSEMLVELSSADGADDKESSILTDLSESELVSLNVDEAGEVDTKIDLARAYMDMGDPDGAKDILDEVLAEGNASQKEEAQKLKDQLS